MRKLKTMVCGAVMLLLGHASLHAQAVSAEDLKAQLVKDWERAKAYTLNYLNTMPADKYGLKPTDSIRSFAQQMLHLAQGNAGIMGSVSTQKPPFGMFDMEHSAGAQTKDSVVYYVSASYDYCINTVKNSDVNKWGEKVKAFGRFEETRLAMMMKTFEHQTHHRGQTTIYIRLAGVKPPNEQLF